MDFRRVKKRGDNRKTRRTWLSSDHYRIVWRGEIYGVNVPARFQACIRTIIPNYGGHEGEVFEMWDFTDPKHRLFKTLGKAEESCERHKRLWTKACEATGIRGLIEIFGKLPSGIPLWAKKKLPRKVYEILGRLRTTRYVESECEPDQEDPTKPSDCSASPTEAVLATRTPASPAEGKGRCTTPRTRRAPSKATSIDAPSAVPPAEAAAKGRKRRAAKRTRNSSKSTGRRGRNTTNSPASDDKSSGGSRKKRSKPSGS